MLYSKGIGMVQFNPVVRGKERAPLEFTNVQYVPSLSSNLFSVLYLTMHHNFNVFIKRDTLNFNRAGQIVFQAKVNFSNATFLAGETIPVEESASLSSSIPPWPCEGDYKVGILLLGHLY
jgi:hypothetical protein